MISTGDKPGIRRQIIVCTLFAAVALGAGVALVDWMFYFFAAVLVALAIIGIMLLRFR